MAATTWPALIVWISLASNLSLGDGFTAGHSLRHPRSSILRASDKILLTEEDIDDEGGCWQVALGPENPYRSIVLDNEEECRLFLQDLRTKARELGTVDPFWEQIRNEAAVAVAAEPEAGPQIYQGILSQPNFLEAICTVISHQIETELIPATYIKNLFIEMLETEDVQAIRHDLQAVATRSPSIRSAMSAVLFHNGYHALVCYRVAHRLWLAGRKGLAYYMQSTVSRKYSADIHPACRMGSGIYIRVGAGVVIGETAVIGNDVSILEGVTLGGTGKEDGDRHPKVGDGVIIQDGGTVLGNIKVGNGSIVSARAIVTKPVPPLAIMSGVPAKVQGYRILDACEFEDALQEHLLAKYIDEWKQLESDRVKAEPVESG